MLFNQSEYANDLKDSRGVIPNRVGIEERPPIVETREIFGDLEIDLIIGKNHKSVIATINDRASGMLKMKRVESKKAELVSDAIIEMLQDWKPCIKTMASDNGKEFTLHQKMSKSLLVDFFFARPYHSWERGANENLNGLIRQYFPKASDFNLLSEQKIKDIETKIDNRPRKRFNFESPIFVMNKCLTNKKVAFVT